MANEKVGDPVAQCPDFSPTDYTLYVNQGFVYVQRQAALSVTDDPNNPWYTRAGMLVLGTAATPLAWAEEYIARPIANIPFTIVNAPVEMAENMGCAGILLEDGQTSEAVPYLLRATAHGAEGFVAVGSVVIPVEGGIAGAIKPKATLKTSGPIAGGGAKLDNLSSAATQRIQNAANRTQQEITVIGSRASGKASSISDWDYIMSGKSSQRHSARSSVPRGTQGGEINSMGNETGIDVWQNYNPNAPNYSTLNPNEPHIIFRPQ